MDINSKPGEGGSKRGVNHNKKQVDKTRRKGEDRQRQRDKE